MVSVISVFGICFYGVFGLVEMVVVRRDVGLVRRLGEVIFWVEVEG